jgi:hypothetical protein
MLRYICSIFSLCCIATVTLATAPKVLNISPSSQAITVLPESEIVVTFDMQMDIATISNVTFRVFGKWSGPATGTFSFPNGSSEVHFLPDEKFFAGEVILVQLSKGIKNSSGEFMEKPFAWTYSIATAPGDLNQVAIDTIELRYPGEGLIETYGTYAGDMNNDGYSDLVTINEESDDLRTLMNNGTGGYPDSFTLFDTGTDGRPSPHEGADINNDGEIDLVVGTAWSNELRVLTGDGNGGFSNMDVYFTSEGVRGVVVGDFNGDGWDDVLTTNRLDEDISIFMNDGDGTFTVSNMDVAGEDETSCALADINKDGILDVFYGGYDSHTVGTLLGNGDGSFTYGASVSVSGPAWMITSGDFNNDGNADVAAVTSSSNQMAVLFGDGLGGLEAPVHYSSASMIFPLAIDAGDLDGDGDLDIVTSNYSSANFCVFENTGGVFMMAAVLPSEEAGSCATLHDRDNDGDLDITAADEEEDVLFLFDNAGTTNATGPITQTNLNLQLYPNPANTAITVKVNAATDRHNIIAIYDLSGKRLSDYLAITETSTVIPLIRFEEGMYLLKMETKSGLTISSHFVISR